VIVVPPAVAVPIAEFAAMVVPIVSDIVTMLVAPILPLASVGNSIREILYMVTRSSWAADVAGTIARSSRSADVSRTVARSSGSPNITWPITGLPGATNVAGAITGCSWTANIRSAAAWSDAVAATGTGRQLAREVATARPCAFAWKRVAWAVVQKFGGSAAS